MNPLAPIHSPFDSVISKPLPPVPQETTVIPTGGKPPALIQTIPTNPRLLDQAFLVLESPLFDLAELIRKDAEALIAEGQQRAEQEAMQLLGHLTLLYQKDPTKAEELFADCSVEKAKQLMKYQILPSDVLFKELHEMVDLKPLEGFQSAQQRLHQQLPRVVASMLLLDDGKINVGIISSLQRQLELMLGEAFDTPQSASLVNGLKELEKSKALREVFEDMDASKLHVKGQFLVRVTCGLSPEQSVTDQTVRLTVLTSLLSRLRQGSIGSCFATSVGIGIMVWDLKSCAQDLYELLKHGELKRGDPDVKSFPFLLKMPADSINELVSLDREGKVNGVHLMEEKGIRAACYAVGIPTGSQKRLIDQFIASTFRYTSSNTKTVTPYVVIRGILTQHLKDTGLVAVGKSEFEKRMIFAFEGQARSALLRCWEQTLANMAEVGDEKVGDRKLSPFRRACIESLSNELQRLIDPSSPLYKTTLTDIEKAVKARTRYLYDPGIAGHGFSRDGHSTDGGWVLYDTEHSLALSAWTRVDTKQEFKRYLKRVAEEVCRKLEWNEGDQLDEIDKIRSALKQGIKSKGFIDNCRDQFVVALAEPGEEDDGTLHPWCCVDGNWSEGIFQVYYDLDQPPKSHFVHPQSAEHLLNRILRLVKAAPESVRQKYEDNPHLITFAANAFHAFSLTLAHPSLVKAWKDPRYTRAWIEEELVNPGRALGQKFVSNEFKEAVALEAKESAYHHKKDRTYEAVMAIGVDEPIWRCDFRNQLMNALLKIDPDTPTEEVDSFLLRSLPEEELDQIKDSMIHIADSNWHNDEHDIHYVIGFNPFSYKLEMFHDDGSGKLQLYDQKEWLLENRWQFLVHGIDTFRRSGANLQEMEAIS